MNLESGRWTYVGGGILSASSTVVVVIAAAITTIAFVTTLITALVGRLHDHVVAGV
jgi:hypothetical protein